jgi:hypothetical protein
MAQDKLDILYDALERDGAVTSGRENFRAKMLAPGEEGYKNRLALFTALKQDNAVESNTYEEFAANLGLHAVKPAKQEDPAEEQGGAAQPNADDYARAAKNNALAVARGRDVLHQAENAQEWQKANFGLNVPKVELGLGKSGRTVATAPTFNAKTGKQERTYITQSGNEYTSQASAEREQAALDNQQEQARKLARAQEEIDRKRQEELAGIDKQLTVMREQYDRIKGTDQTSETRKGYIMQAIDRLQQQRDAAEKKYRGRDVKAEYELGGGREQLEAAKEEVANALKDIEERRGEKSGFMEFAESQFPNVTSYIRRWTDPEYGKAKAAEQALEDTENTIKQATREGFSNNTAFNVARGAWDATRDIRTWDFGANDWADSRNLAELVDKSERIRKAEEAGKTPEEHLTATEQRVLDAMAVSSTLDANFSEHVPMSYRVGQSVPASAGFAASIYINPLNGLGAAVEKQVAANAAKGGVKEVLKGAMKTAGKTVMKNVTGAPTMTAAEQSMQRALTVAAVNKYGKWGVRAMNTAGRVIGDGVEALGTTLTTGLPRTMASINERQTGTFIGRVDDSGRIVYDRVEDRETGAKSYLKGGLASYFENQSELVGEYFSPIKNFANLAAKDMPLARSMVERFIASSPKQKASLLAEFRKKAHISGLFGEYAEEVINNLENAVFTGDMNLTGGVFEPKREDYKSEEDYNKAVNDWKGSMFNAETNLETFLSVAAMIMPMAAIEQGQKRYNSYTVKRQLNTSADALRKSLGEETAVPLMTRMREAESIKDICDVYMSVLKDGGLKDSEQARALMDYAGKLVAYQSVNTSDMSGEISANRVQRGYKSAFDAGHEMAVDERHNAAVEFDNAAATATEMLGKDFVMAVRDMDLPQFQEILKTLNWEQKKAATDVYLSSVRLSGIMAGAHDRVDEEADKYGNTLNLMSDEEGNAWRGSNLGENEYVVPSSLSDEGNTLVVRDMGTGALRMIPREEAGELTAVNASEETEARRKQLWEQAKDEVRWNLNHHNKTVQPAVGETVSISMRKSDDEDNETQRFLIVKEDEEGNFYLLPTRMNEAGEEEAISGTPFKATADELLSSQDYVYEQEDAAQRDAERSAVEETTEGGATEETPTDGSSVVIEGTPATEEDAPADTAVPTRSEVAAQLDATEEGRSARAMVDGWVRDENDAETIHEWIDLVDESEWDAKTKQLLHDYVDSKDAPDEEGPTGGSSAVVEGEAAPVVEGEAAPAVESKATPKIPLDKDGAPQYDKAPVQATVEDLYDGTLDDKEVGEFIEAQIAEADKNVKKLEKRKPKVGTDKAKYLASKKKWEDELEDARHKAQYWNDVKAEVERITTPADAQGWEGELNDDNARTAYRAQRKAENGIPTQQEFIADFMASAKIAPESFRKETGGGTLEQKQWAGRIAKEGDSIERLSEKLVDLDNTENGGRFFGGDSAAARDAIIDFLKSGRDKTDQEQEFVEQYNAQRDAYYNERYGMSYEDYIAYTEQEMPEMLRRYSNFDEQEFTKLYADEIEEDLRRREEQAKQQSNGTEGNDSAGEEQSDGGSHQVQPGERTDDTRGGEERADTRAEEDAGDEGAGKPEAAQENAGGAQSATGSGSSQEEIAGEGTLNREEAITLIAQMEERAEVAPQIELTIENWDALFDEGTQIPTPVGDVKMGENQFAKLMRQGRNGKLGMLKPTLENPDFIVEDKSEAKEGDITERGSSYVFVKTFHKADGSRYYYFTSVTVRKDGREVVISNQEKRKSKILDLLLNGKLVWKRADDVSTASDVADGLYSSQGNKSDLATEGTDAPQTNNSNQEDYEPSEPTQSSTAEDVSKPQNPQQGGEETINAETPTTSSEGKGKEKASTEQGNDEKSVGNQIEAASAEVNTEPTEAQKEAGNYKKGHVQVGTFDITIEQPQGSVRRGTDADGKQWESKMNNTYGYIRGTVGVDGDHIDVFLSNDIDGWDGRKVFVVDQYNPDGSFDEHKVMLGFNDADEAKSDYLANYEQGWENGRRIDVSAVNLEDFEKWIESSTRKTKPFGEYSSVKKDVVEINAPADEDTTSEIQTLLRERGCTPISQEHRNLTDEGVVADNAGNPITLYHGTLDKSISVSELEAGHKRADGESADFAGSGVYFTPNKDVAEEYGYNGQVFEAHVKLSKPFYMLGNPGFNESEAVQFSNLLKSKGYDGIINYMNAWSVEHNMIDGGEVVVFNNSSILPIEKGQKEEIESHLVENNPDFIKANDHARDVEQKWEEKIQDYLFEHYPTQATLSAETTSEKGQKEREAMKADPVLKELREKANAEYEEADKAVEAAYKKAAKAAKDTRPQKTEEVIKGTKWEATPAPEKYKTGASKHADSHATEWKIGKIRYGSTKAETGQIELAVKMYSGYIGAWNAYEQGKILLAPNEAAIIKEIIRTEEAAGQKPHARLQKADEYSEFAAEYGLDGMWLSRYAEGMRERNSAAAAMALHDLKAIYLREHIAEKKALMERDRVSGLLANKRLFEPVEQAIKAKYGDVDVLIEERRKQAEIERGMMEAARKKAEEEEAKRQQHLEELSLLTEDEIDERYADALAKGDEATAREMLDEAARRKGYGDVESDYQGVGAWGAPSKPDYETDEARRNAVGEDSPDLNVEDMAAGYSNQPEDIFKHPDKYSQGLPTSKESGKAIQTAIDDIRNGKKDVRIKVYRAVPTTVKEGKLRNGDWVTPSRRYAELHGDNRLEGKYRIIEDEVPAGDLWWDSNDVNEWGYDNGKSYRYKNVKNNRKQNDLVTRDDKGNIIPPSKRFNSRKADERYQRGKDAAPVTKEEAILRDAVIDRMRENGMDVITNEEEGQRVMDEANGKVRTQMGDAPESFAERQKQAVENRGIVMPGLNDMSVKVLDGIPRHSYTGNIAEATKQAIQKAKEKYAPDGKAKVLHYDNNGTEFDYTISGNAIEICLSPKHQAKSGNKGAHLALAEHLDEVINHSVEVEEHPDYIKGKDGKRGARINPIALMHRFYGAVVIDGVPCRVMTLMREEKSAATDNGIHSYEVQKIEVLDNELPSTPNGVGSQNQLRLDSSYPLAKLLKGVEKSYDKGKKLLEESEKSSAGIRENRVWHGSGAEFEAFDHSHIGEGQGSQSFGWGTYVTSSKAIGRTYAEDANNKLFRSKFGNYYLQKLREALNNGRSFESEKQRLLDSHSEMYNKAKEKGSGYNDFIHDYEKLGELKENDLPSRHLYTVEITDDNGKNYLDWDSRVGARVLNKVNRQLEQQGKRPINPELDKRYKFLDGNDLYRALSIRMPNDDATFNDDKAASEFLYSLGFVGIRYKAGRNFGGAKEGDTNYVIFNEKDAKITDHVRFFRTADGEAYGFTVDGKIYIDPKIANSETPVHEYAHLWASALRQSNAKEWANVVGLMKDTAVWEEVKKHYPELKTDDEIADEVLATYSGRRGAERLRKEMEEATKNGSIFDKAEAMSAMQKIRQALDTFWKSVADFLHIHYTTAEEVADRVMKDLLDGVDPRMMNDGESLERVNEKFNEQLAKFTEDNSDKINFNLGSPSAKLLSAGVADKPIRLHGSKVAKKMKKHGFSIEELHDLPKAVANPIAVFDNLGKEGNRSVLTELKTANGNFLVAIDLGKGTEADFDIVSSVFGKKGHSVAAWINKGYMRFVDKKKALNYLHLSAPIAEASDNAELSSAAKVIQDFENPKVSDEKVSEDDLYRVVDDEEKQQAYKGAAYMDDAAIEALNSEYRGEWLKREGEGQATDEEVSLANDPVSKMIGKSRYSAGQQVEYAENMRERMTTHAQELAEKLHLSNVEIVADGSGFTGKRQKAKGFYNKTTGKITVVIGNHTSMADVEKTILHEAVAHHGLRQLFGEHFDQFLDNVYESCDYKIRQKIDALMEEKGYDQRTATEEYLASLAEDMNYETTDPTFWTAIKEAFLDMLHTLGFDYAGPVLTDNELRYILWRSYKNLEEPGSFRSILGTAEDLKMQETLGVGQYETEGKESAAAEDLFREDDISRALNNDSEGAGWSRETMQRAWDDVMSKASFLAKEGYFDYLASVDEFQKLVERATGEKVSDMQNAYKAMLQLSSRNANEMKLFDSAFARPLQRAVYRLIGAVKDFKKGKGLELSWYLISKHGIERNRDMAIRAAMKEKANESYAEQIHEATAELKEERTQLLAELTRIAAGEESTLGTEAAIKARVKQIEAEIDSIKKHPNKHGLKTEAEFYEDELDNWYRTASFIKEYAEENGWTWRETQEELTRRAADFGADVTEDYSGLSALVEEKEDFTEAAYRRVENYENTHYTDDLWEAIRAMSGYSLEKQRSSGLTTKKYVDDQLRRYDFFVPLRGWADPTAEEMYDYLDGQRSELGNPVKTAKGRKSEADNPLGGLLSVAYRSIASGNKNMALQHFYNLVSAHNTNGLAVIDSMWVENRGTEDAPDWVLATPELTDPMTGGREMSAEEVQAELDRFNADMREKAALGMAIQMKKGTPLPPYRVTQQHARAHQIRLSVGGTNRVITIVGNPRVAMALNGLLNPENSGWPILRKLNNFMAGAFTNYNVSFGGANLARDTAHSNLRAFIGESPAYWWALTKKQNLLLGNVANWARMVGMLRKYEAGKPMTGYHERMFKEFMDGGGATGYTMIRNQKESTQFMVDMVRDLKNINRRKLSPMRMFEFFSFLNEAAELVNRFVAYETSREMGRTRERSIDDAKEATLNFNRKGAGAKSLTQREGTKYRLSNALNYYSQYGRSFIVFFNAHVQGTYQLYRLVKEHPAKFAFAFGAAPVTAAAVALPLFNNLLLPAIYSAVGGDGDDDWGDYYYELSDWERQHNICLRLPKGHGWLKIPLTPELGAMFQVGDVTGASFAGKRDMQASDFAGLMELVAPNNVDFTDAGTAISSLVPSSLQWASHIAVNRDFKGSRLRNDNMFSRYQPEYLKATRSTSATITAMSRALNKVGGGNDERSADNVLDFSPGYVQEMLTGIAGGWASTALAVSDALAAPYLEGGGSEKDYWKGAKGLFDRGGVPVLSRFWISGSGERNAARAKGEYMRTVKPFMGATESEFSLIKRIPRPAALDVRAKEEKLEAAKKSHDLFAIAKAEKSLEAAKANFEEAKKTQRQKLDALQGSERFKAYRDMRGITRYIDYMLRLYKDNDLPDNVVDSLQEANRRLLEVEK